MPQPIPPKTGFFRSGRRLVIRHGSGFPNECICCGADIPGLSTKLTLVWSPYASAPARGFVRSATFLSTRQYLKLKVGLCDSCRRRRKIMIGSLLTLMCVSLVTAVFMIYMTQTNRLNRNDSVVSGISMAALAMTILPPFIIAFPMAILKVDSFANGWIVLRGAGKKFLDGLPEHADRSP